MFAKVAAHALVNERGVCLSVSDRDGFSHGRLRLHGYSDG